MFFVAWFWAYFDAALYGRAVTYARDAVLGGQWPPVPSADTDVAGLGWFAHTFNPGVCRSSNPDPADLRNDGDLGASFAVRGRPHAAWCSGCSAPWCSASCSPPARPTNNLMRGFDFTHHIYGSTFFMATGFHGFHVIVGTIFLTVCLVRAIAAIHAEAAFRLRGRGLVLAFRRRGLAVPVHLHLCVGRGGQLPAE